MITSRSVATGVLPSATCLSATCAAITSTAASRTTNSRLIDDGKFLYARGVDTAQLDPWYPWLVQNVAPGTHDATVVFVNGQCFGFRFATPRHDGCEDWRITINTKECLWAPWVIPQQMTAAILEFMRVAGLKFGRL